MSEQRPQEPLDGARRVLAHRLKHLREKSGRSLAQLAEETKYDRSYLNRLERGEKLSKLPVMQDLDELYGTDGLLADLWELAKQEAFMDRYRLFMQSEARAVIMDKYMVAIPGLLQTEDYARIVLSSDPALHDEADLSEQVALRIGRQEILRRDPPPMMRVIFDECALRRPPVGDAAVWRGQLARLLEASADPHIKIQVLPFKAGVHDLMGGSLSLLWMADGTAVAYLEGSKSGELVEDSAEVTAHRLSYDQVRDLALSPPASAGFIKQVLEDSTS